MANFHSKYDDDFWNQSLKKQQRVFKEESLLSSGLESKIYSILSKISIKPNSNVTSLKVFAKGLLGSCFDGDVGDIDDI